MDKAAGLGATNPVLKARWETGVAAAGATAAAPAAAGEHLGRRVRSLFNPGAIVDTTSEEEDEQEEEQVLGEQPGGEQAGERVLVVPQGGGRATRSTQSPRWCKALTLAAFVSHDSEFLFDECLTDRWLLSSPGHLAPAGCGPAVAAAARLDFDSAHRLALLTVLAGRATVRLDARHVFLERPAEPEGATAARPVRMLIGGGEDDDDVRPRGKAGFLAETLPSFSKTLPFLGEWQALPPPPPGGCWWMRPAAGTVWAAVAARPFGAELRALVGGSQHRCYQIFCRHAISLSC